MEGRTFCCGGWKNYVGNLTYIAYSVVNPAERNALIGIKPTVGLTS
jgi:hypothetical protein